MEDTNKEIAQEEIAVEQEKTSEESKESGSITKSLKQKQKTILSTLKDSRSKNVVDMLWFVWWSVAFGGLLYLKHNIWAELKILNAILYYFGVFVSFFGIIYKLNDLYKNHKTKIDSKFELSIIEDDIFLEEIKGLSNEEKALKQLSKKQADIEKYHTLNLAHTKIIFVIGVVIIFIGIAIIASTIISTFLSESSVKLMVIIPGFVGGLLVDAVGAVFILMYTKTIEAANKFQSNMVETANTYLGNVLVSQISNIELRERTLSMMARELVQADRIHDEKLDEVKK